MSSECKINIVAQIPSMQDMPAKELTRLHFLKDQFRPLGLIGEGTFSVVFKAEDLRPNAPQKYVALKRITGTTHPSRVATELQLLKKLAGSPNVISLLQVYRESDQIIAVFPLFEHTDFRIFSETCTIDDIRSYMRCLLVALTAVHAKGIVHRDLKPANFLYSKDTKKGILIDFGLAEYERRAKGDWYPEKGIGIDLGGFVKATQSVFNNSTLNTHPNVSGINLQDKTNNQCSKTIYGKNSRIFKRNRILDYNSTDDPKNYSPSRVSEGQKISQQDKQPRNSSNRVVVSKEPALSEKVSALFADSNEKKTFLKSFDIPNGINTQKIYIDGFLNQSIPLTQTNLSNVSKIEMLNDDPCVKQTKVSMHGNPFGKGTILTKSTSFSRTHIVRNAGPPGYFKNDTRPPMRAPRAGTRGFRAPEVLFKVKAQNTKIDMWASGVIMLILLTKRYPFFAAQEDIDALVEIANIFGTVEMKKAARSFGRVWRTNIESIPAEQIPFETIIKSLNPQNDACPEAIDLLYMLLELNPEKRITAECALRHPFFKEPQ